jgi:hypothetical protein
VKGSRSSRRMTCMALASRFGEPTVESDETPSSQTADASA